LMSPAAWSNKGVWIYPGQTALQRIFFEHILHQYFCQTNYRMFRSRVSR
jgi:hypothetical protein